MHHAPPEDVEKLLAAMVAFNSVDSRSSGRTDAETAIGGYLESLAQAWSLRTVRLAVAGHADNILILHEAAPAAPWLLFVSHMDTVAVEGMSIEPFALKIENGKMYGRGACDTKGSGAAMLWALRSYAAQPVPRHNNIALLFSVNEESGMMGILSFTKNDLPRLELRPGGAIVGEPTRLAPVVANNGSLRLMLHAEGVAAHSSEPGKGRSAVSDMARLIVYLEDGYISRLRASHPLTGRAQCSINVIHGGHASNIVPPHCSACLDRRLVPGEDPEDVRAELEQELCAFSGTRDGARVRIELEYTTVPLAPLPGSAFYPALQEVLERQGLDPELRGVSFGTEAGVLSQAGIPSVVLGPGNLEQAHTKDEWLLQSQLHQAVDVYGAIMRMEQGTKVMR